LGLLVSWKLEVKWFCRSFTRQKFAAVIMFGAVHFFLSDITFFVLSLTEGALKGYFDDSSDGASFTYGYGSFMEELTW